MARVEQITDKSQVPTEWHPLYDRIAAARGRVAGPYSILLHAPATADRVDQLSNALRSETEVDAQGFVLAALAVARARDCLFVWSVQAPNARRSGVSEDSHRRHSRSKNRRRCLTTRRTSSATRNSW